MCEPGVLNFTRMMQTAIVDHTQGPLTSERLLELLQKSWARTHDPNAYPEYETIWQRADDDASC